MVLINSASIGYVFDISNSPNLIYSLSFSLSYSNFRHR
ncbi:hypothetical protein CoNPh17_CDS0113 [Staphylococcus phage S-CoN_Ph17]|nr:hypothetical protein CoNPh17_CDS0113 [Staphylococcus phage S-CoN_Ph17]